MQDDELVLQFQNGDEHAFDVLVKRYENTVRKGCFRFLNNAEDASDAAQEVFIKAYYRIKQFKPNAKFSTWLYRIMVNHCLNVIRARKRRSWLSKFSKDNDEFVERSLVDDGNPAAVMELSERRQAVEKAISALNEKLRTAVILHKYQGLSYKEIAEVEKISLSAVESRIHRAKKKLAVLLKDFVE